MPITSGGQASVQTTGVTSFDIPPILVATGTNPWMWVAVGTSAGAASLTTSVTRNVSAQAFTELTDTIIGGTDCHFSASGAIPNVGSGTITVVLAGLDDEIYGGAICLLGVDQATPTGTVVTGNGVGAASPTSITVGSLVAGDVIIDSVYVFATAITVGANQISRFEQENINGFSAGGGSTQLESDGGVMTWTYAGSVDWNGAAIAVHAAAEPAASTATVMWLTA